MEGLFDTHAHLLDERFASDLPETMERMRQAGVSRCMLVGDGAADPLPSIRLAQATPGFYAAVGVHPHDASAYDEAREAALRAWLRETKVYALGEIGLDYHYDLSPREAQREAFERQLDLALEMRLPVILHIREAHGEATELLSRRARQGRLPGGVMHCYTGRWESAKQYLDMGLYISFSGAVTFKNAPKLCQVAQNLPQERLLTETDCPYMAPVPMRGKRNEPAFVRYTLEHIAHLRGQDAQELAHQTAQNGLRCFGISE